MTTPTWIIVGTGGVGKTTIAAALAHALAHGGARTLVTTFDPARRLADALGVPALTSAVVPVTPRLAALVPDAGVGARDLVERLLASAPGHAPRLATNPLLAALTSGFAGIHELVALLEVARAAPRHDALVIDTAPARHALELLALPTRLGEFVDGRALAWLGALARHATASAPGVGARLLRWGPQRLVHTFAGAIGEAPIQATLELLAFAADVRPALSPLLATARALLAPAHARALAVVAARPGAAAELAQPRRRARGGRPRCARAAASLVRGVGAGAGRAPRRGRHGAPRGQPRRRRDRGRARRRHRAVRGRRRPPWAARWSRSPRCSPTARAVIAAAAAALGATSAAATRDFAVAAAVRQPAPA